MTSAPGTHGTTQYAQTSTKLPGRELLLSQSTAVRHHCSDTIAALARCCLQKVVLASTAEGGGFTVAEAVRHYTTYFTRGCWRSSFKMCTSENVHPAAFKRVNGGQLSDCHNRFQSHMHESRQHQQQQLQIPKNSTPQSTCQIIVARVLPAGRRGGVAAGGARGGVSSSCSGSLVMLPRASCASAATSPMDVPCGCGSRTKEKLSRRDVNRDTWLLCRRRHLANRRALRLLQYDWTWSGNGRVCKGEMWNCIVCSMLPTLALPPGRPRTSRKQAAAAAHHRQQHAAAGRLQPHRDVGLAQAPHARQRALHSTYRTFGTLC
jgi:hypothetical protein